MQVYRGMDIGTAKPTPAERAGIVYHGLDLVSPDQTFSAGDFLRNAREVVRDCASRGVPLLVAGGTGLYFRALWQGLDSATAPSAELREKWRTWLAERGLESLQAEAERRSPGVLARMADPDNPRRLLRVLERLDAGDDPLPRRELESTPQPLALPCLHVEPSLLAARIAKRIEVMLADGFEEEVRVLAARYPQLSHSAAGAIGYAEVLAMLRGEMEREVAMERIAARTRQLAKRQRTWFRNQAAAVWIDGPENELDAQRAGVELMKYWRQHGNVFTFG